MKWLLAARRGHYLCDAVSYVYTAKPYAKNRFGMCMHQTYARFYFDGNSRRLFGSMMMSSSDTRHRLNDFAT